MGSSNRERRLVFERRWARLAYPPSGPSVEPVVHITAPLGDSATRVWRVQHGKRPLGQLARRPFRRDPGRGLANPWEPRGNARGARGMGCCSHVVCHGVAWMGPGQAPRRRSGGCGEVSGDGQVHSATVLARFVDRDLRVRTCGLGGFPFFFDLVARRGVIPSCVCGSDSVPILAHQPDRGKVDKRREGPRWRVDGKFVQTL